MIDTPELSILMPVYNERKTALCAINRVASTDFGVPIEIVLVDDGSTDGTTELLADRAHRAPNMRLIEHGRNQGKGRAIQTALDAAKGRYVCIFDADLEYDPADLVRLLEPLRAGTATVTYGVRRFESHNAHSFWYVLGNRFVTLAANLLFDCWLRDMMTCLKIMDVDLFRSLDIRSTGFEIEAEITAKLIKRGERIYELPVSYAARSHGDGKKIRGKDALRVLRTLLRVRYGNA